MAAGRIPTTANSPITAKGDLFTYSTAPARLAVGTNGQYLQADSSTVTGLTWSTVSGYSAPTLGSTSIGSGATVTTINGLVKIASAAHVSLDASGYEQDTNLMHIMDAW